MNRFIPFALVLSVASFGCIQASNVARTRGAHDLQCAESDVKVQSIGGDSYEAVGCGKKMIYNCVSSQNKPTTNLFGKPNPAGGGPANFTCVPENTPAPQQVSQ
jgi:hypothetical protein